MLVSIDINQKLLYKIKIISIWVEHFFLKIQFSVRGKKPQNTIGDTTESYVLRNSFAFPFLFNLSLSLPNMTLLLKHRLDIKNFNFRFILKSLYEIWGIYSLRIQWKYIWNSSFWVLLFYQCSAFTLYLLKLRSSMKIQTQKNFIKALLKEVSPLIIGS